MNDGPICTEPEGKWRFGFIIQSKSWSPFLSSLGQWNMQMLSHFTDRETKAWLCWVNSMQLGSWERRLRGELSSWWGFSKHFAWVSWASCSEVLGPEPPPGWAGDVGEWSATKKQLHRPQMVTAASQIFFLITQLFFFHIRNFFFFSKIL